MKIVLFRQIDERASIFYVTLLMILLRASSRQTDYILPEISSGYLE